MNDSFFVSALMGALVLVAMACVGASPGLIAWAVTGEPRFIGIGIVLFWFGVAALTMLLCLLAMLGGYD